MWIRTRIPRSGRSDRFGTSGVLVRGWAVRGKGEYDGVVVWCGRRGVMRYLTTQHARFRA